MTSRIRAPGAGRPVGTTGTPAGPGRPSRHELYPGPVRAAENRLRDRLPEIIEELLVMAFSRPVVVKGEDGEVEVVYETPPAVKLKALIQCLDRVMGKPVQPVALVDAVRTVAMQQGLTDAETAEAVREAERLTSTTRLHAGA